LPHEFLLDRNLGTRIVPEALRGAGWSVRTLADVYGEAPGQHTQDEEWLAYAGLHKLRVLMLDKKIRYHQLELDALVRHRVIAFCLTSGNLDGPTQARRFLDNESRIMRLSDESGPAMHMISSAGMRRLNLD